MLAAAVFRRRSRVLRPRRAADCSGVSGAHNDSVAGDAYKNVLPGDTFLAGLRGAQLLPNRQERPEGRSHKFRSPNAELPMPAAGDGPGGVAWAVGPDPRTRSLVQSGGGEAGGVDDVVLIREGLASRRVAP